MKSTQNWKDIPGFIGYQASDQGQVRRGDKLLKQHKAANNGGLYVNLGDTTRLVHKLVWLAFVGPVRGRMSHLNGDRCDNRLRNLQCGLGRSPRKGPPNKRCSRGHELTGANVARWGSNRICVACRNGAPAVRELPEYL